MPKKNKLKIDKRTILNLFSKNTNKEFNYKQIAALLTINNENDRSKLISLLDSLVETKDLKKTSRSKYTIRINEIYSEGKIDLINSGNGFFVASDASHEDLFVKHSNLNSALDQDLVKVQILSNNQNQRAEAKVVKIIKRHKTQFVGNLLKSNNKYYLAPDNQKSASYILISYFDNKKVHVGDKVIAELIDAYKLQRTLRAKILKKLGKSGEPNVEIQAIISDYNLTEDFSDTVLNEAEKINDIISQKEINLRKDLRNIKTCFTIDPTDAKDFDDAISFEVLNNNNYSIGIHIADVSFYVREKTNLDTEAYRRGCSTYLVDRVIPMLPHKLSNNICSLTPNDDKLCLSVIIEINKEAEIINSKLEKTIIKSKRRFNYDEVKNIIDTGKGDFAEEITIINNIAKKIKNKRMKHGSFNFDHADVKFELDENGYPLNVYFKQPSEANDLIEEFMLIANRIVAEALSNYTKIENVIYRIHDKPNELKLSDFLSFVNKLGYAKTNNKQLSIEINDILEAAKGKPEQNIIENLAIRSMSKAIYSCHNIGHYGLAFKYYTHFTSPIRRYPDLIIHRLLTAYINNNNYNIEDLEAIAKHSSDMEQQSTMAERASIKYKQAEYMQDKIGKTFEGIISGINDKGIFVMLKDNACEGYVSIRSLQSDYYTYKAEDYCFIGCNTNKCLQLGTTVSVKIISVNLQKRQIDFKLIETILNKN